MSRGSDLQKEFYGKDFDFLAEQMAHGPTSDRHWAARAEMQRRQAEWQKDTATAQSEAAKSVKGCR
jgi:hypothetical protein